MVRTETLLSVGGGGPPPRRVGSVSVFRVAAQ